MSSQINEPVQSADTVFRGDRPDARQSEPPCAGGTTSRDTDTASELGSVQSAQEQLLSIRQSIDNIDATLVHILAERFKFTQTVGVLKASAGMPASDPDREKQQIARLRALAVDAHLDPTFAENFLAFIVSEVINHHKRIAEDRNADSASPSEDTK